MRPLFIPVLPVCRFFPPKRPEPFPVMILLPSSLSSILQRPWRRLSWAASTPREMPLAGVFSCLLHRQHIKVFLVRFSKVYGIPFQPHEPMSISSASLSEA